MRFTGVTAETMKPGIFDFVVWIGSALLMSFGLAHAQAGAAAYARMNGAISGLTIGFWVWLLFVVPVSAGIVFSEQKHCAEWA
jgi:hypothetical protein